MTVQNFSGDKPRSVAVVSGSARNTGTIAISQAVITVVFYDGDGKIIDTTSSTAKDLQPGETWNFSLQNSGTEAWKISKYAISAKTTK